MKKYFFVFFSFFLLSVCLCNNKDKNKEDRYKEGCKLGMKGEK